ncbi:MAG TPA: DUF302 domain-containing protein, partial [Acidimicrobiia bacterium]|nr:DUF302 domain-containing protein [Acidimicrobiia bacterium]
MVSHRSHSTTNDLGGVAHRLVTPQAKGKRSCLDIPLDWKVYVPVERTIQIGKEHKMDTSMLAPTARHNGIEHRSLTARVPMSVTVADSQLRQALGAEGFDVLDEIAATGLDSGGDRYSYRILVTYHPILARRAIETEPGVGLVLPTNVVIRADGEMTEVQALDPAIMGETTRNPALGAIIIDARGRLGRAIGALRSCVELIELPAIDAPSTPPSEPD